MFVLYTSQLFVLTGVRYLQTAMENVVQIGDPNSESDGWILENSLSETARYNFNIIKNLGKCCHVGDDPNIDVPNPSQQPNIQEAEPSRQIPLPK